MAEWTDRVVEGALSRNQNERVQAGEIYLEHCAIETTESEAICSGMLVLPSALEFDPEKVGRFEEQFTPERIAEFTAGAEPTSGELEQYRTCVIEEVEDGECDFDLIPAFWIHRLLHTDGRSVCAVTTVQGYSFTGVNRVFKGFADTAEAALRALAAIGETVGIERRDQGEEDVTYE